MSHVGTKLAARLRGWAIRRWQFVSGFISSRKVRGFVAPILVGLFPIAVTLRIIRGNWVSVPFKDEWWHPGGQIVSFFHGTLRFVDLFQQHNESRPLFPRLYNLLMTALTGRWDVKDAMVLMFLLACVGSFLLLELLRRTTSFDLPARLWAWALLNFVFFCPREYENFLWSTILIPQTPGVVLLAAMLVNLSELRLRWKILTNSALAFVATYSFSGGMLLWVLAVPIYLGPRLPGAQNRRANPASWYAFYAFCGIVAVGFYFHHYVRPTRLPPFAVSLADALPLLRFFLSWIGSLFVVPGAGPLFFGCFYLAIFAALIVVAIRVARSERNFRRSYPWIVMAASAFGWGALVASGRLGFGIGSATASRYAVNVVFFYIGLAGLAASLYDVRLNAGHRMGSRLVFASGLTMGLFTAAWLSSFTTELSRIRVVREERKDLALAVQWIPAIPLNPDLALGSRAPPKFVADVAISLARYDALRPRFIPQLLASTVRQNPAHGESLAGTLGSARFSDDHRLLLTGMAWLSYRNAKADCVVVGYTNSDSGLTPFTVFQPTYMRERLKGRFDIKHLPLNGFAASIDPANLPTGTLTLRAWAVDMRAGRALPMAGVITVDNEPVQIN
jgi:hypothetical protein